MTETETISIDPVDETEINSISIRASKNTPFATILKLKEKYPNISAKNLGKLVGISKQAVCQMFARHGIDFVTGQVVALDEYKVNRADIMAVKQIEALNHIDHRKLNKANIRDLAMLFGILYDKERLERGLSTSNQAVIYASAVERAFVGAKEGMKEGDQTNVNEVRGIEQITQPIDYTTIDGVENTEIPPKIPLNNQVKGCKVNQVAAKKRGRPPKVGGGSGAAL